MVFGNIFSKIRDTFGNIYEGGKKLVTENLLPALANKGSNALADYATEKLKERYLKP